MTFIVRGMLESKTNYKSQVPANKYSSVDVIDDVVKQFIPTE